MRFGILLTSAALALGFGSYAPVALAQAPPPLTPSALSPCGLTGEELSSAFGLTVDQTQPADMTVPSGRDVGCLYTFKESSFELTLRQTWDGGRAASSGKAQGEAIGRDPDGAVWKADPADRPGAGGDLTYRRGKVQTRLHVRGGRLTGTEVLKRLLLLRRVP